MNFHQKTLRPPNYLVINPALILQGRHIGKISDGSLTASNMCGIAGIFDPTLSQIAGKEIEELVKKMVLALKHRGPDDEGVFCAQGMGMGSSRLSILDLSSQGRMPMADKETGNQIVYNGEVYNYKELKQTFLQDAVFSSQTDTEVILKLYAKYGEDCVKHFNGMYSFCIWNPKNKRIFCVRDRLGIKPFFYFLKNNVFYFASEIKALLQCGIQAKPNLKTIYDYLVFGVYDHSQETFFEGIKQLPAGHALTVEPGRFDLKKYWDIEPQLENSRYSSQNPEKDCQQAGEEFLALIKDSIALRLRSDVPIAVHVSGGLDSTFMLAAINQVKGGQENLKAFSYYYGEEKYDERPFVAELVKKMGWDVEYFQLSSSEVPKLAQEAMWFQEQPFPGIITLAKHKLIKESQRFGAKVILEGQGGDEIGAGYQYVFGPYILDLIEQGNSELALREIAAFGEQNNLSPEQSFAKVLHGLSAYYQLGRAADGTSFVKTHCLNQDFLNQYRQVVSFPRPFKSHLLNMQYRDIRYSKLPRILRSCDRASMAFGRELRVPLLDYRLVELAFSLPGSLKIQKGAQRYFMRQALKKVFPNYLAALPKRAVVDPQREWLKGPLSGWLEEIFSSLSFKQRGIFDVPEIQKEYQDYRTRDTNLNSFFLWQWLCLELWFRTFIDQKSNT